jgi:hypothetical protein
MSQDCQEMLDELGEEGVVNVQALHVDGAIYKRFGHLSLNGGGTKTVFYDRGHDPVQVFFGKSSGHEWVLNSSHDRTV